MSQDLQVQIEKLRRKVATLAAGSGFDPTALQAEVDALEATVAAEQAQLDTAQANITALQSTVAGEQSQLDTAQSDIAALQTTVADEQAQLDTAQSTISTLNTDVAQLKTQMTSALFLANAANSRLDYLEPDVGALTAQMTNVEEAIFALQQDPPHVLLTRSTTQSISNGGAGDLITWGTDESYVSSGAASWKSSAANILTVPADEGGVYFVSFSGQFATNSTGVRQVWLAFGSNASSVALGEHALLTASGSAHLTLPSRRIASGLVHLDAGATISAMAYQNSGGALNFDLMRLSVVKLAS